MSIMRRRASVLSSRPQLDKWVESVGLRRRADQNRPSSSLSSALFPITSFDQQISSA